MNKIEFYLFCLRGFVVLMLKGRERNLLNELLVIDSF